MERYVGDFMADIEMKEVDSGNIEGIPYQAVLIGMSLGDGDVIASTTVTGKPITRTPGSAASDDKSYYDPTSSKKVQITLDDNDDGAEWAFENDDAVYAAVNRKASLVATGFYAKTAEEFNRETNKKLLDRFNLEVIQVLEPRIPSIVTYLHLYMIAFLKKLTSAGKLVGCVELNSHEDECKPIRDLSTGELGGKPGLGLDAKRPNESIAVVQYGYVPVYNSTGTYASGREYFYYTRDEIIPFSLNDRGKFKGRSPILRVRRAIEVRRTLVNITELVIRRFGPQLIVTVGNKDVNFNSGEIPSAYLTATVGGVQVDRATAKANYRKAVMDNVKSKMQLFSETDTLIHIQEYGYSVETLNPPSTLPDYIRFINEFGQEIKNGILGIFTQGRIDITSAAMEQALAKDMKDSAEDLRKYIINKLNREYVKRWLEENTLKDGDIQLAFNPIDKVDAQAEALVERTKSEVIRNIATAGYEIPQEVLIKLGIKELKKLPMPVVKPGFGNSGTQSAASPGQIPSGAKSSTAKAEVIE